MKRTKLEWITKLLVNTALRREKADLVIKGETLVNVDFCELLEDVVVKNRKVCRLKCSSAYLRVFQQRLILKLQEPN